MSEQPQVTTILERVEAGEEGAVDELFELVYGNLRKMAQGVMRGQHFETMAPTALVHEAYIKLFGDSARRSFSDHREFFAQAATAMRSIFVDYHRYKGRKKRSPTGKQILLDSLVAQFEERNLDLMAIDEVLERLQEVDPRLVKVVELRLFSRHSCSEIAEILGVCTRTVDRDWQLAQAKLRQELGD